MNNVVFGPAKLLILILGKYSGELVMAAAKRSGAKGGTKVVGRGHGLTAYCDKGESACREVTEALIFTLMREEAESVMQGVIMAGLEDPENVNGLALVIDAAAMARPGSESKNVESAPERLGSEGMRSGNVLITCIITHGQAEEIMRVAREAGARGGTIMEARGTGTEDDVKFFGISLASEKEMLLIVSLEEHAQAVLEAICGLSVFSEPGGGIVYTTPVEKMFTLGR